MFKILSITGLLPVSTLTVLKKNLSGVIQDMGYPQLTDSNYSRNKHDIVKVFSLETIIHELKIIHGL